MRIGGSREEAFGRGGRRPAAAVAPQSASRALTVLTGPAHQTTSAHTRGDAAFLAQLIATREQVPQTRAKRRAEPTEALAAYRAVAGMVR
jgi:hypothetical protein